MGDLIISREILEDLKEVLEDLKEDLEDLKVALEDWGDLVEINFFEIDF
jgi:hypothetical protein